VANLTASLLTKGTKSKNAQEIARLMDSLGSNLSGFSGKNNFGIRMECLSEDFLPALDLFEDIFKNPTFSEEELGKEKERVKAAIKAKDDSILKTTNRALKKLLFLTHPLRFESEGSLESVERIQQKDVASFYSHFINSRNMVISVFGDIKPEDVLGQLEKRFGLVKPQDISLKSFTEEPPAVQRQKRISMKKEQAMMALAFQGPNMFAQDRYGVEVLTSILGSSFDGRMFRNIREKLGKAYSLGGSYSAGVDMGLIYFYVLTTKEDLDKVESLLTAEINNLKEKEVPEEELKKIKTYLKGRFWARLETNAALVSQTSADEFFGLGFKDYKNYESAIDKITAQDIKRMAVQYLNFDKSAVVFTTPKTGE